jgi:two-component system chemotaxis response regulator CheY
MSTITQDSKRVLVADDDPIIRRLVTSAVLREGFEIVVVNDGREAYRILQSDANLKAAIFDMMMPHLEGLDIIRFMKTEKRLMRIPAMIITSEQNLKLMSDSFSAGASLFLRKPFTSEQLQATLRILLSTSSPTRKAA